MSKFEEPTVPFVEARHVGGHQKPTAIVVKMSSTTSEKGAAYGIASYHHMHHAPFESYHYIIDEDTTYRCVPSNISSYGNLHRAINVLMCAPPHQDVPLWEGATASRVMYHTASLVADLMLAHNVRLRELRGDDIQRWMNHRWRLRGGLIVLPTGVWPHEAFFNDVKRKVALKTRR